MTFRVVRSNGSALEWQLLRPWHALVAVATLLVAQSSLATATRFVPSSYASVLDAHPCRFLPPSRCWAQNFDAQNEERLSQTFDWGDYLGSTIGDDENFHVKARTWKLHNKELICENQHGSLYNLSSTGTMALIQGSAPFSTDNVFVQYDFMVEDNGKRGIATGFAFRVASMLDYYRFEWSDEGWMSVVRYTTILKKRTASVLGQLLDAPLLRDEWYHVEMNINAGLIDIKVKSVNRHNVPTQGKATYTLTATDAEYRASLSFDAGFYASGEIKQHFDDVIIVAHSERRALGRWDEVNWPTPCPTLSSAHCYFESFEDVKLSDMPHEIVDDGRPRAGEGSLWKLVHEPSTDRSMGSNVRVLAELNGYGVTTSIAKTDCHRQYGTYFVLKEAAKMRSSSIVISFQMRITDPLATGIGIMLRIQEAFTGFQGTASYYRFSWGQSPNGDDWCDSILFHNGHEARFETLSSEPSERTGPKPLEPGVWHRIEIHLSPERIEVSRNGELVGRPIEKKPGAASLRLTWGDIALYCGGHGGTEQEHKCMFDNILIVDADKLKEAVVKPDSEAVAPPVRPPSNIPVFDVGPLGDTVWEGVRRWSAYYYHNGTHVCLPNDVNMTHDQPVAIRIRPNGDIIVLAHQVNLASLNSYKNNNKNALTAGQDDEPRYLFAENRLLRLAEDYIVSGAHPRLKYKHTDGSEEIHCMIWKLSDTGKDARAGVVWSFSDDCAVPATTCGFSADLQIMGQYSRFYPPTITIIDPKPGANEQWSADANMSVAVRLSNVRTSDVQLEMEIRHVASNSITAIDADDFDTDEDEDQWLSGSVVLRQSVFVQNDLKLGANKVVVKLENVTKLTTMGEQLDVLDEVQISIECRVCMRGRDGQQLDACEYWCGEPGGCPEPKCTGRIRCSKKLAGWDDNQCTRWATDKPALCTQFGACSRYDDFELCSWDIEKVPIVEGSCVSPSCRLPCNLNTPVPPPEQYLNRYDWCESAKETKECHMPNRCHENGECLAIMQPHFAPAPTPRPPTTSRAHKMKTTPPPTTTLHAPPTERPLCKLCLEAPAEPGEPFWCQCCEADCDGARQACVLHNGFCSTRCVDDTGRYCSWAVLKNDAPHFAPYMPGPHTLAPTPVPKVDVEPETDDDAPHVDVDGKKLENNDDDTDDVDPLSSDEDKPTTKKVHLTDAPTPKPTKKTKASKSPTPAPLIEEAPPAWMTTPKPTTHELAFASSQGGQSTSSMSALAAAVTLLVVTVLVTIAWRRLSTQRPIDIGHLA